MIFLQQLSCGYEFPALIHAWIASAVVLEWFTSTSGEAPQNDCLTFSFVKDIKVSVKKMTRNRRKMIEKTADSLLL